MTTTFDPEIDPVTIDTQIAEFNAIIGAAYGRIQAGAASARNLLGERKVRVGRSMRYASTDTDALDRLENTTFTLAMDISKAHSILDAVAAARAELREAIEQRAPLEAIYETRRWTRFSEVVGGHIHAGHSCAGGTIRSTTLVGWRVDLSGTTIDNAVAELGPTLCSHCFPGAPLEWRRSAAEVKAEAEAAEGIYCDSVSLTREQGKAINWRRRSNYVTCHACGNPSVSVTSTGRKRKHKRLGK